MADPATRMLAPARCTPPGAVLRDGRGCSKPAQLQRIPSTHAVTKDVRTTTSETPLEPQHLSPLRSVPYTFLRRDRAGP